MSDQEARRVVVWIYALRDPRTGETRYVGKSVDPKRRLAKHLYEAGQSARRHLHSWIRGLLKEGLLPDLVRLEKTNGVDWKDVERRWISDLREQGVPLVNLTNGGDGTEGLRFTEEIKAKIGAAHKGKPKSPEQRKKMSDAWQSRRDQPISEETRAKMSAAKKGRTLSAETRAKMSLSHMGRTGPVLSPEARQKIADANRGRKPSDEERAKMSAAAQGKPKSPEHRRKIGEANRGRTCSAETRAKISQGNRGRKHSEDARTKMGSSFIVTDPSGLEFEIRNLTGFARERGFNTSMFHRVLAGKQDSYKGWRIRRPDGEIE